MRSAVRCSPGNSRRSSTRSVRQSTELTPISFRILYSMEHDDAGREQWLRPRFREAAAATLQGAERGLYPRVAGHESQATKSQVIESQVIESQEPTTL